MSANIVDIPISFKFYRKGGADIRAEVQIWQKLGDGSYSDRPVKRISFYDATSRVEYQDINLMDGEYVCVILCKVREALNGVFDYKLTIAGDVATDGDGDVNTTSSPYDMEHFRSEYEILVEA